MPHHHWTTGDLVRALIVLAVVLLALAAALLKAQGPEPLEAEPVREVVQVRETTLLTDSIYCADTGLGTWACTTVLPGGS